MSSRPASGMIPLWALARHCPPGRLAELVKLWGDRRTRELAVELLMRDLAEQWEERTREAGCEFVNLGPVSSRAIKVFNLTLAARAAPLVTGPELGDLVPLAQIEWEHIRLVCAQTLTVEEAAKILDVNPATLYRRKAKNKGAS